MIGSFIRRFAFWLLDIFTGSAKIKHLKDIKIATTAEIPSPRLKDILEYAKENVPYYQNIRSSNLLDFPVMNKSIYREEGDLAISKEFIKHKGILHTVSTSGSTGTPMTFYQDKEKRNRVVVDLIHAHNNVGWKLGDNFVFIRNWLSNYRQSRIKNVIQNVFPLSISDFDDEHKRMLTDYIIKHKPVLFGYSSAICDYLNFLDRTNNTTEISPRLIICDSDELSDINKKRLKDRFRCPVISRYDNEENGLLAIASVDSDIFTVNYQSLKIELLALDSDDRVRPGEVGRVVVTDYFNKAMPLIRYDTGDLAISMDAPDDIRHLEKLCGRSAVALKSTNGLKISSVSICAVTEVYKGIIKYQLVQMNRTDFVFKYIGTLSDGDLSSLTDRLISTLGADANIIYEQVTELKSKPNGKFASIVNEYKE